MNGHGICKPLCSHLHPSRIVFAIIGLHVFGGLEMEVYGYPNFNTFVNSLVSTFLVLTVENYQYIM